MRVGTRNPETDHRVVITLSRSVSYRAAVPDGDADSLMESLILAQDERWRRA